jgi:pimeloyl-ACP methyl ester carboxylesterase
MRSLIALTILSAIGLGAAAPLPAQTLVGTWQATTGDRKSVTKITKKPDGALHGELYFIGQEFSGNTFNGNPISSFKVQGGKVHFDLDESQGTFDGSLAADGNTLTGSWIAGGGTFPLKFERATPKTAWVIDPSPHKVVFVPVDKDVRLEVLDWGGNGPPLVLLTGNGNTAHVFDAFALKFTGKHHVYAIRVRGHDLDAVIDALCRAGVDRVLRQCAVSGVGPARLASVEALGAFPGPATCAALSQAARRGGQRVRLAALRSLLQAGGEVRVARILNHVQRKQLPVSGRLAELLDMVVAEDQAGAIAALARSRLTPRLRVLLIEALSGIDAPEAWEGVLSQTGFPLAEVRAAAIAALGKTMRPSITETFLNAMRDPDWRVRCAAAQANAEEGVAGFVDSLVVLLMDEVWLVRFNAEAALNRLGVATGHAAPAIMLGAPKAQPPFRSASA